MPGPPTISVVIPTFQRREQVAAAVRSVLGQDREADEVVVVDDGSTDGTAGHLRRTFGEAVVVVGQPNRGASAARNTGMRLASGELVAFCDSDNSWRRHHLSVIASLARAHPEAVLVSTQRKYHFGKERLADAVVGDVAHPLLTTRTSVALMTALAVRREIAIDAGGFDESLRYGEDVEFFLRLSLLGPFAMLAATTFDVIVSPDSLQAEGQRCGAYSDAMVVSGERMLRALDRSTRHDVDDLRRAASARIAIGRLFTGLAAGDTSAELRSHVADIRRLAPVLDANPVSIPSLLPTSIAGWEDFHQRRSVLARLLLAWPLRPDAGSIRLAAAAAIVAFRPPPKAPGTRRWRWRHP